MSNPNHHQQQQPPTSPAHFFGRLVDNLTHIQTQGSQLIGQIPFASSAANENNNNYNAKSNNTSNVANHTNHTNQQQQPQDEEEKEEDAGEQSFSLFSLLPQVISNPTRLLPLPKLKTTILLLMILLHRHDMYQKALNLPSLYTQTFEHNVQLLTALSTIAKQHSILRYNAFYRSEEFARRNVVVYLQRILFLASAHAGDDGADNNGDGNGDCGGGGGDESRLHQQQQQGERNPQTVFTQLRAVQTIASKSGLPVQLIYSSTTPEFPTRHQLVQFLSQQQQQQQQPPPLATTTPTPITPTVSSSQPPVDPSPHSINLPPPPTSTTTATPTTSPLDLLLHFPPSPLSFNIFEVGDTYYISIGGSHSIDQLLSFLTLWPTCVYGGGGGGGGGGGESPSSDYVHSGCLRIAQQLLPIILCQLRRLFIERLYFRGELDDQFPQHQATHHPLPPLPQQLQQPSPPSPPPLFSQWAVSRFAKQPTSSSPQPTQPTAASAITTTPHPQQPQRQPLSLEQIDSFDISLVGNKHLPHIIFTGAHIGSSIAAIMTMLINDHNTSTLVSLPSKQQQQQQRQLPDELFRLLPCTNAILYSPPAILSPSLQKKTQSYIISTILNDDWVPRFSEYSVNNFLSELFYETLTREVSTPTTITNPYSDCTPLFVRQGLLWERLQQHQHSDWSKCDNSTPCDEGDDHHHNPRNSPQQPPQHPPNTNHTTHQAPTTPPTMTQITTTHNNHHHHYYYHHPKNSTHVQFSRDSVPIPHALTRDNQPETLLGSTMCSLFKINQFKNSIFDFFSSPLLSSPIDNFIQSELTKAVGSISQKLFCQEMSSVYRDITTHCDELAQQQYHAMQINPNNNGRHLGETQQHSIYHQAIHSTNIPHSTIPREDFVYQDIDFGVGIRLHCSPSSSQHAVSGILFVPGSIFFLKKLPTAIYSTLYSPKIVYDDANRQALLITRASQALDAKLSLLPPYQPDHHHHLLVNPSPHQHWSTKLKLQEGLQQHLQPQQRQEQDQPSTSPVVHAFLTNDQNYNSISPTTLLWAGHNIITAYALPSQMLSSAPPPPLLPSSLLSSLPSTFQQLITNPLLAQSTRTSLSSDCPHFFIPNLLAAQDDDIPAFPTYPNPTKPPPISRHAHLTRKAIEIQSSSTHVPPSDQQGHHDHRDILKLHQQKDQFQASSDLAIDCLTAITDTIVADSKLVQGVNLLTASPFRKQFRALQAALEVPTTHICTRREPHEFTPVRISPENTITDSYLINYALAFEDALGINSITSTNRGRVRHRHVQSEGPNQGLLDNLFKSFLDKLAFIPHSCNCDIVLLNDVSQFFLHQSNPQQPSVQE